MLALPPAPTGTADDDTAGGTAGLIPAAYAAGGSTGAGGASAACAALGADLPAGDATDAPLSLYSPAGNGDSEELPGDYHAGTFGGAFLQHTIQTNIKYEP